MNIQGKLVTLRAPELADVPDLNRWSNDPEIWKMLGGWHFPFSARSTEDWIRSRKDGNITDQIFCIDTEQDGLIGTANLVSIDWKNKNAFHGMMLGDKDLRGKGYGTDTVMAMMRYCFEELGLNRLDGSMVEYNTASLKLYLGKCAWKEEGRQRQWYFRDGRYWDRIMVGVTAEDYFELVKRK